MKYTLSCGFSNIDSNVVTIRMISFVHDSFYLVSKAKEV